MSAALRAAVDHVDAVVWSAAASFVRVVRLDALDELTYSEKTRQSLWCATVTVLGGPRDDDPVQTLKLRYWSKHEELHELVEASVGGEIVAHFDCEQFRGFRNYMLVKGEAVTQRAPAVPSPVVPSPVVSEQTLLVAAAVALIERTYALDERAALDLLAAKAARLDSDPAATALAADEGLTAELAQAFTNYEPLRGLRLVGA